MQRPAGGATVAEMAELVAIGYPDETSALAAEQAAQQLADELIVQPDAIAAVVRRRGGTYQVVTNHHAVGSGPTWGMFWCLFFGLGLFVPVLGMAMGAGLGALFGKLEQAGIDKGFQAQVRELLRPGTSALFLLIEESSPDRAVAALGRFGGTVLKTSISAEAEAKLQAALHGASAKEPVTVPS
jgi:uncharacterized membrane protein